MKQIRVGEPLHRLMMVVVLFCLPSWSYASEETNIASGEKVEAALALLEEQQVEAALEGFQAAFEAGETDGGFYIGRLLETGFGVEQSISDAVQVYQAAAEAGSPRAYNRLGLMHLQGDEGLLQDFEAAREYVCKAAELGFEDAHFNCGEMLALGRGGDQDLNAAVEHFKIAAEAGNIGALNRLGDIYRDATFDGQSPAQSASYFEQAAMRGNMNGLFEYASALEAGFDGKDASPMQAHVFFNIAKMAGHPSAGQELARLSGNLSAEDLAQAQSMARVKLEEIRATEN